MDAFGLSAYLLILIATFVLGLAEFFDLRPQTPQQLARRKGIETSTKYILPTAWAVGALQGRLYDLCEKDGYIEKATTGSEDQKEDVLTYTCYILGSWLGWERVLWTALEGAGSAYFEHEQPYIPGVRDCLQDGIFDFLPPSRRAIAELMVVGDESGPRPMEWFAFKHRMADDGDFRRLFSPITKGLVTIADAKIKGKEAPDQQLRRLQHGLLKSLDNADPEFRYISRWSRKACRPADVK